MSDVEKCNEVVKPRDDWEVDASYDGMTDKDAILA